MAQVWDFCAQPSSQRHRCRSGLAFKALRYFFSVLPRLSSGYNCCLGTSECLFQHYTPTWRELQATQANRAPRASWLHEAHRALDDREKRTQGLTLTALLLSWLYCALACLEYYTPTMDFTIWVFDEFLSGFKIRQSLIYYNRSSDHPTIWWSNGFFKD